METKLILAAAAIERGMRVYTASTHPQTTIPATGDEDDYDIRSRFKPTKAGRPLHQVLSFLDLQPGVLALVDRQGYYFVVRIEREITSYDLHAVAENTMWVVHNLDGVEKYASELRVMRQDAVRMIAQSEARQMASRFLAESGIDAAALITITGRKE